MGGSTYAHRLARRTRNTFKPVAKALAPISHELMNVGRDVSHQLMNTGRQGIRQIGGAKVSDSIAGFNKQIPSMVDAGTAYAMGAGVGKRRVRGRGVKGGALIAAGY